MNTSFGPRIKYNRWDFHDGIDLPAPGGTKIHAMRQGRVHRAGPGGSNGYSSRHVVIEVDDPTDGPIYNVYLHLDSIAPAVVRGASVEQGQVIGTVGDDDAVYPHLHFEFRKGTHREIGSVHPLNYLPYADTARFTKPAAARFNWLDGFLAARVVFKTVSNSAGGSKLGDLKRVKVHLRRGAKLLTTRGVDFDDKDRASEDQPIIGTGAWRKWRLELLRVATREATAILYLGEDGRMTERARVNWNSTQREPRTLHAGIGLTSKGAAATVLLDELWVTESELSW